MLAGTLKGFVSVVIQHYSANPFRVIVKYRRSLSQGFKANPGLRLANTFGVKTLAENKKLTFCFTETEMILALLRRQLLRSDRHFKLSATTWIYKRQLQSSIRF